jgi:hypothetical protein
MVEAEEGIVAHYDGPERRHDRQSSFDRLLHSVWGVVSILVLLATVSASVALGAQRFVGAPAANARLITGIIRTDSLVAVRITALEARQANLEFRAERTAMQLVDLRGDIRRLGLVLCASLGDQRVREVRVACAALTSSD